MSLTAMMLQLCLSVSFNPFTFFYEILIKLYLTYMLYFPSFQVGHLISPYTAGYSCLYNNLIWLPSLKNNRFILMQVQRQSTGWRCCTGRHHISYPASLSYTSISWGSASHSVVQGPSGFGTKWMCKTFENHWTKAFIHSTSQFSKEPSTLGNSHGFRRITSFFGCFLLFVHFPHLNLLLCRSSNCQNCHNSK